MTNRLPKKLQQGFTLVELLVVIGILGILAAALLAVIDPIEQLNKAQDTSKKSIAVEYVSAFQRYYATRQAWPMDGSTCGSAVDTLPVGAISGLGGCTTILTDNGELKASFADAGNILTEVFASKTATGTIMSCFDPESKAYQRDPLTKYTDNTGTVDTCNPLTTTTCFWCAQ